MKAIRLLTPVLACLLLVSLIGCHSQVPPGLPAPPAIQFSSGEQSQVEQIAQDYVKNLQAQDYQKAEAMMSPAFRAATPTARLKMLLTGPDQPFLGAKNFQFDPVQLHSYDSHVILRARFLGGDGKSYRTNFLLAQAGKAWQVSGLITPTTHKAPIAVKTKGSSS